MRSLHYLAWRLQLDKRKLALDSDLEQTKGRESSFPRFGNLPEQGEVGLRV